MDRNKTFSINFKWNVARFVQLVQDARFSFSKSRVRIPYRVQNDDPWCNGNTADFGSVIRGSNPRGSTAVNQKFKNNEDINYNRKVKFLGLSSLKQEVEHIARKYDIAVSTVHSSYTSKMCPICGCIEDENRPNQETFECIDCGYECNADFNAATNIKNRVSITVLCNSLLKQMDNGAYEPKKLKREKVKEVLLSYRTSLIKDREFNFYQILLYGQLIIQYTYYATVWRGGERQMT